jgi:hypothetical protein
MKVDLYPYLYGSRLMVPVSFNGEEQFEGEVPLKLLFKHFIECAETFGVTESEDELYDLLYALEDGIDMINELLYGDE